MAERQKLAALLNGLVRNVDLTVDELVVDSITLGGPQSGSGTNLTKTQLDDLIANSHASGSDNQTITAGDGLTGGGSGASVTLDVGAGDGIVVNANDIAVAADVLRDADTDATAGNVSGAVVTLTTGGKLRQAQVPAIAITEVFVAATIAARDALTVGSGDGEIQEGDVVIVTDASADPAVTSGGASYIYDGSAYERLLTPDSPVTSVNGATGVVSLDTDDISEGSTNLYYTEARVSANTDVAANTAARHDAVTLNSDDPTQETLNLSGQEIQVNLATSTTDGAMSATDKDKLDNIEANATADQNASEVDFTPAGDISATDVQAAIEELDNEKITQADLDTHINDTTDAHDASAISYDDTTSALPGAPDNVQAAIEALDDRIDNVESGSSEVTQEFVAGESFAANTSFLVRFALTGETAGRVYKADNDASSNDNFYAFGMALSTTSVSAGDNISVRMFGEHVLGSSDTAFNAADIGLPVYLGSAGAFTITAPSGADVAVFRVGIVQNTDRIMLMDKQLNGIDA